MEVTQIRFVSAKSVQLGKDNNVLLTGVDPAGQSHCWALPLSAATRLAAEMGELTSGGRGAEPPAADADDPPSIRVDPHHAEPPAYRCAQLVAPYHPGSVPTMDSFREVQCRDFSATGFSFLLPTEPDFELLMVLLLGSSAPTRLVAKVVHSRQGYWDGKQQYIVGCHFVGPP